MTIKFGTDGWRAIIGQDYTYENVGQVLQAFCDLNRNLRNSLVVLGYDRRFCSREFSHRAAEVLLGNGFKVLLANDFCPTPCISWMTQHRRALAGVVITASHNPYQWNGVKFKEGDGGSASPEYTNKIERQIEKNMSRGKRARQIDLSVGEKKKLLQYFDPHQAYLTQLKKLIQLPKIKRYVKKVVVDPIYGAGSGYFVRLLGKAALEIRGEENPGFGGVNPEPIEANLAQAIKIVKQQGAQIALATDGDADRIGAVDEKGNFINSHQIYSLILRHLVEVKGWKGDVIKTISTTQMIDRIGQAHGLNIVETPIGFKYICQQFRQGKPLMGGEESGGIGIAKHVYERDGLLSGLMLLDIMAHYRKPISEIIAGLQKEYGPWYFIREDLHLAEAQIKKTKTTLGKKVYPAFSGMKLSGVNTKDGYKFLFTDGSWLLIRPSGTEPLLRIYAEAPSKTKAKKIIQAGIQFAKTL